MQGAAVPNLFQPPLETHLEIARLKACILTLETRVDELYRILDDKTRPGKGPSKSRTSKKPRLGRLMVSILESVPAGATVFTPLLVEQLFGSFDQTRASNVNSALRKLEKLGFCTRVKGRNGMWIMADKYPTIN